MKRIDLLSAIGGTLVAAYLKPIEEPFESDVVLDTGTGILYGTLAVPAMIPAPVVLIIAGSGPTDRNGNSGRFVRGDTYKLLAAALVTEGVATLRYDKRGVGQSADAIPQEKNIRFETFVEDAEGWLSSLRSDRRFSAVAVAGHSEGSLIGMIAVQRQRVGFFVSLEGAGYSAAVVLREQLKGKVSPDLYAQCDSIISRLQHGQLVPNPPPELFALFRESVQPYLISYFQYDPSVEIARVQGAVTIVQGTADVQVGVENARALERADPRARLALLDGMNHVLKYAPDISSQAAILRGYGPGLPIDGRVVEAIAALLKR